jgi:capsid protein
VRAAWLRAVWVGDAPGAIDPLKEAKAATERYTLGITTLDAESIAYDGVSWADKHAQQVREKAARVADGIDAQPAAPAAPTVAPPPADGEEPEPADGGEDETAQDMPAEETA